MLVSNFNANAGKPMIDFSRSKNSNGNKTKSEKESSLTGLIKTYTKKTSGSEQRISNLQDRRQQIAQRKAEYVASAKSQGVDQQTINEKVAEYDSQISQIDQQIAQIRQEDQQKATEKKQGDVSENQQKNDPMGAAMDSCNEKAAAAQSLMNSLISAQNTQGYINTVQSAQNLLKTEALSYAPSHCSVFHWNPEKYAELNARADSLNGDIAEMEKDMQDSGEKITKRSPEIRSAEEKTAQEKAVENYKKETERYSEQDDGTDLLNQYA